MDRKASKLEEPETTPPPSGNLKWPIVLTVAGFLCTVPAPIFYLLSLKAKTSIAYWDLVHNFYEWPLIPFGLLFPLLATYLVPKRSKLYWAGIGIFLFSLTITILLTEFRIGAVFFGLVFILGLMNFPKTYPRRLILALCSTLFAFAGIPHYDVAGLRSHVLRTQSDLRSMALSIESYRGDYHAYPLFTTDPSKAIEWKTQSGMPSFIAYKPGGPYSITTPISYMSSMPVEMFYLMGEKRGYAYYCWDDQAYIIISAGPNCVFDIKPDELNELKPGPNGALPEKLINYQYDPTNGGTSAGDIFRVEP
ncbi:hypothetical protein LLG95_03550 [bacterium]|nr:hypothetical protein [bacterium]